VLFIEANPLHFSSLKSRCYPSSPRRQTPIFQFLFIGRTTTRSSPACRAPTACSGCTKAVSGEGATCRVLQGAARAPQASVTDRLARLESASKQAFCGDIQIEFLPPHSPDLNPVEPLRNWHRRNAFANFCPANLDEPYKAACAKFKTTQRRPSIIAEC
jgi:transposase